MVRYPEPGCSGIKFYKGLNVVSVGSGRENIKRYYHSIDADIWDRSFFLHWLDSNVDSVGDSPDNRFLLVKTDHYSKLDKKGTGKYLPRF